MGEEPDRLITNVDVRQYFQTQVTSTLDRQGVAVQDETVIYLSNLLTGFTRSESLYDQTSDGVMIRPLAEIYGQEVIHSNYSTW